MRKKSDKIIRISSEEKRNLMNGILRGIENEKLDKPQKRVTWDKMTDVENKTNEDAQHPQIE